jgi:hypothetical protein
MEASGRYLVWNMDGRMPTHAHSSYDSAITEAERLAKENPGHVFHVMASVGFAKVESPRVFKPFNEADHHDRLLPF